METASGFDGKIHKGESVDAEQSPCRELEVGNDRQGHEAQGHERFDGFGDAQDVVCDSDHLAKGSGRFQRIGIGEQAGHRQGQTVELSSGEHDDAASDPFQLVDDRAHGCVAVSGHDDIVRVVSDGRGYGSAGQLIAFEQAETDLSCALGAVR